MLDDHNLDIDQKTNAKHYEHPVTSRDDILAFLKKIGVPLNRDDLFAALNLQTSEEYEGLRRRLRAMERDGQLVFTKKQCYALPENLELITGYVIGHKDGHGWVRPEDSISKDDDIILPFHQMKHLLHGDKVVIQVATNSKKGRKEGRVVRMLQKRQAPIIGRFFLEANNAYVIADDLRISKEIVINLEDKLNARMGNVVVVEISQRSAQNNTFVGKITQVLGDNMAAGMETKIAIHSHEIPCKWPQEVLDQVANFGEHVPESAKQNRIDLRNMPLITIDGVDARDFDDAVYCERKKSGGWRLWVAIADVSYYVRPNSALDKEAINRGNSVYFPSQVVPMLPEELSNGLCSLNPQVDRLCMVCEMTISASGNLSSYKHYEAVMNSHARLTYDKVYGILQGDQELSSRYHNLIPHIQELHKMYLSLRDAREKRGAIEFETIESKFIFNADRKIAHIEPVVRNDAHKIIEECMILANIASASIVEKAKEAALYRIHDIPSEARLKSFRTFLAELGLNLAGGAKPLPTDYATLVHTAANRADKDVIFSMLLRSMQQAVYSTENIGHFGLALKRYAHFTSPIRRYPDLLLHRVIKYLITKNNEDSKQNNTGAYHYSMQEMSFYAEQCSMTERRADEATRSVASWLKCEYMQDHIGDKLEGIITNVTNFGFFVNLNDLMIDGLVHVSSLTRDYYNFDPAKQLLIGERSGTIYRFGDKVTIKVVSVNLNTKQVNFELVSSNRRVKKKKSTIASHEQRVLNAKRKAKEKKATKKTSSKLIYQLSEQVELNSFNGAGEKKKPKGKTSSKTSAKKTKTIKVTPQKTSSPTKNTVSKKLV